jgi:hypothetical protein
MADLSVAGPEDAELTSAADAANGIRLGKQLASETQMAELGKAIAGAGTDDTLRNANQLARTYGGSPSDWAKMRSSSYTAPDGQIFETHWYKNVVTGEVVEYKTKFPDSSNTGYK